MCKRYLLGTLSPKENYRVDNSLLENDFYFEAMDGLEQVPWQQSEKHLKETEARIIKEFSINKDKTVKKNLTLAGLGLFIASLLGIWYFASTSETSDFTQNRTGAISEAPNHQEFEDEIDSPLEEELKNEPETNKLETSPGPTLLPDDTAAMETPEQLPPTTPPPTVDKRKPQVRQRPNSSFNADVHITVGRIVDTKGLAIPYAVVTSGSASDTTDVSGYFALKVAKGGVHLQITHLGVPYPVDIDTNQNWQITLDVANKTLLDYRPINAANRFK